MSTPAGPGRAPASPGLTALPRLEDLPQAPGGGYDADRVRDAFDAFRRHYDAAPGAAAGSPGGRSHRSVEPTGTCRAHGRAAPDPRGRGVRRHDRARRTAGLREPARADGRRGARRQRELQDREAGGRALPPGVGSPARRDPERGAERGARAAPERAARRGAGGPRESEARAAKLLEQARHQATELTNAARAEVEQTLEWARAQARRSWPARSRAPSSCSRRPASATNSSGASPMRSSAPPSRPPTGRAPGTMPRPPPPRTASARRCRAPVSPPSAEAETPSADERTTAKASRGTSRPSAPCGGVFGPRFVVEAIFLVAVALVAGLAQFPTEAIVLVMALAWLLVAGVVVFDVPARATRCAGAPRAPVSPSAARTGPRGTARARPATRPGSDVQPVIERRMEPFPEPELERRRRPSRCRRQRSRRRRPVRRDQRSRSRGTGGSRRRAGAGARTGARAGAGAGARAPVARRPRSRTRAGARTRARARAARTRCRPSRPAGAAGVEPLGARAPRPRARRGDVERDEERSFLLVYLRDFASPEGTLPVDFDLLVRESFAELLGTR